MICISLCAGHLTKAADSLLFRSGDSLMLMQQYEIAAVEYERTGFISSDNITKTEALLRKAEALKLLNRFAEAEKTLQRVSYPGLPGRLIYETRYRSALNAYLGQDFAAAESHLLLMELYVRDTTLTVEALPLYALVLNELEKWDEAGQKLIKYIRISDLPDTHKDSLTNALRTLYNKKNHPKLKSLKKAQTLSSFLPGVGQMYAGYPLDGIVNASLQLISLGAGVYFFMARYYITAVVMGYGSFQRFYLGAQNRLEYLVGKKNHELVRDYNDLLKNQVVGVALQKAKSSIK